MGDGSYEDFLQTDAPINRGNSGGALVNAKGELIGINSQILSPSGGNIGIGFAIPANMARHVMDQLRQDGRVRRAQLGIAIQPVTSELADSLGIKEVGGALVSSVEPGSAADRAGVKRGDVIKSFNGLAVHDTNSLRNRVASTMPGSNATVVVLRDGREQTLTVKLGELAASRTARRDAEGDNADRTALGVSVAPLTPELASKAGVPKDVRVFSSGGQSGWSRGPSRYSGRGRDSRGESQTSSNRRRASHGRAGHDRSPDSGARQSRGSGSVHDSSRVVICARSRPYRSSHICSCLLTSPHEPRDERRGAVRSKLRSRQSTV